MWTTPKKHTKRRETLGNAKQNKTTRRTGYKVYGKRTTKQLRRRVLTEEGQAKSSEKQVVFLTVNHSGPLPFRELHSTGETIVWRDPRGS